ncbi:hypothetical protein PF005_g21891 [Phytophthora fragariae]|uniref:PDZ domain-containing protein n=2 Tax=Phytophthora TaxID=4783 RepID=A0A6A3WEX7_9STRA|nr:hypothetical protein PF003_g12704 [Phytophthora fragariae]KAE8995997.1 hypothetical protein PR002_g19452 [Phytophthora rubi]KAE8927046.1 hypothetical protein PF009_g22777 [Phytophthora fragariae]KAE9008153.1 hypothetical protein PR001_g16780 [Phytophthora rubi]KAE9083331.1 hypothetical protein PF007_g21944 [Phytophthora fragariae]
MSLKRPQHSMDELTSPARSSSKSRRSRSRRTLHSSESTCSSSSSSSSDAPLPLACAPRTVEIMWGGRKAPGFTLKRKRTGAILVSTVTRETQAATTLKPGSELKLVGGFPVNRLTLQDVKKVMLMAPKPVSLVFVNADDVVAIATTADRTDRSLASTTLSTASLRCSVSMDMDMSSLKREDSGDDSDSSDVSTVSAPAFYSTPSESNKSKKRKVSTLQVALDRVNQLLNRPVRQAGLHIAAGKSIVV